MIITLDFRRLSVTGDSGEPTCYALFRFKAADWNTTYDSWRKS